MAKGSMHHSHFLIHWLSGVALTLAPLGVLSGEAQAQLRDPESQVPPPEQSEEFDELRPLNQATTSLSIARAKQLVTEAEAAIAVQDYATATEKLMTARETFGQLSNYYQELAALFVGVDSRINSTHRAKALETAQLRDEVSYQLALVYRSQDRPDQSVPLLMEILVSQQPTRDLGRRAYQQLFELGFVDEPYGTGATSSDRSR